MDENNQHRGGFEETDVNVVAVGKFGVALLLVIMLVLVFLVGVFRYFQAQDGGVAVSVDPAKVFPQPQLQTKPVKDLQAIRQAEDQLLTSYGWVDQQKGIVRIPVEKAMELVVQRGLPARTAEPAPSDVSVPTESALGPKMQPPGGPLSGERK